MMNQAHSTSSLRFGYARVSTHDQDLSLQLDALEKVGCHRIYSETVSSRRNRPELDECLRMLRAGDTLTVWRLDRLGRNLNDLVHIVADLQNRGVDFESLTEKIETKSAGGKLTFHLFAAMAEFERNIIRERTLAGLASARARGRKGGRKPKITEKMKREMLALYESKKVMIRDICERFDISKSAFYRAVLGRVYSIPPQTKT